MRRIVKQALAATMRDDAMNKPFKQLRWMERFFLAWSLIGAVFMFAGMLELPPIWPKDAATRWLIIMTLGAIMLLMNLTLYIDTKLDALRRELWFIEHRLGLPHDPEELEDIRAYNAWLEKQLKRGVRGSEEEAETE